MAFLLAGSCSGPLSDVAYGLISMLAPFCVVLSKTNSRVSYGYLTMHKNLRVRELQNRSSDFVAMSSESRRRWHRLGYVLSARVMKVELNDRQAGLCANMLVCRKGSRNRFCVQTTDRCFTILRLSSFRTLPCALQLGSAQRIDHGSGSGCTLRVSIAAVLTPTPTPIRDNIME